MQASHALAVSSGASGKSSVWMGSSWVRNRLARVLCCRVHSATQVSEVPEPCATPPNRDSSSCVAVQMTIWEEQRRPLGLGRGQRCQGWSFEALAHTDALWAQAAPHPPDRTWLSPAWDQAPISHFCCWCLFLPQTTLSTLAESSLFLPCHSSSSINPTHRPLPVATLGDSVSLAMGETVPSPLLPEVQTAFCVCVPFSYLCPFPYPLSKSTAMSHLHVLCLCPCLCPQCS